MSDWPHKCPNCSKDAAADFCSVKCKIQNLENTIAKIHKDYGCEIRDPYGTIWDHAASLKLALADAIRRPMGVVPVTAEGLVSAEDLIEAEKRRVQAG